MVTTEIALTLDLAPQTETQHSATSSIPLTLALDPATATSHAATTDIPLTLDLAPVADQPTVPEVTTTIPLTLAMGPATAIGHAATTEIPLELVQAPTVQVPAAPTFVFTPPTVEGEALAGPPGSRAGERLMTHYGSWEEGVIVFRDSSGEYHSVRYHPWGATYRTFSEGVLIHEEELEGLRDATELYYGGHRHVVSEATADDLTAAGYGDFITEDV